METVAAIKEEAADVRLWWMSGTLPPHSSGGLILPFVRAYPRLDVWSTIGRALPPKPSVLVSKDVAEKHEDFLRPPVQVSSSIAVDAGQYLRSVAEKVIARGERFVMPFSDSAALCFTRNSGGQANFLREVIALYRLAPGVCPWGDPPLPEHPHLVRSWYEEMFNFLDKPFLDHLGSCPGERCDQPHLHFPVQLTGIPEGGWRTRIPSVPWISLVFMTKRMQSIINQGLFREPEFSVSNPQALFSKAKNLVPQGEEVLISSDWKTGTDALSVDASREVVEQFADLIPETAAHARASMGHLRMIDPEEDLPVWPGIEAMLRTLRPRAGRKFTPSHKAFIREILERYTTKTGAMPGEWVVEEPSNIFHASPRLATSGDPYRTFVRSTGKATKGSSRIFMPRLVYAQDYFVPGHDPLGEDEIRQLSDLIIGWYRGAFVSAPGRLHRRGQHMSLPLSWVMMSALHREMSKPLRYRLLWGDDAIGVGTPEQIVRYKELGESIGVVFHTTRKSFETRGRGVFLETLVDNGKVNDIPKARFGCRPAEETAEEGAWMTAFLEPSKWLSSSDKKVLRESRRAFYDRSIQEAISCGYDPTIPSFVGGLGQGGVGTTGKLNYLSSQEYDEWCGKLRSIHSVSSFDELMKPHPIRSLDLLYLEKSPNSTLSQDEMWLKYFKVAFANRETRYYRFIAAPRGRTIFLGPRTVAFRTSQLLAPLGLEGVVRERSIVVKGPMVEQIKPEARFWLHS